MSVIPAIYEHGVFRPTVPVHLPEGTQVSISAPESDVPTKSPDATNERLNQVYAILGERYSSGHADTAERHNEHQP